MSIDTIGITGTRDGMTSNQHFAFSELMWTYEYQKSLELLCGMCIGVDAETAKIIKTDTVGKVIGYPGHSKSNPDDLTYRDPATENYDQIRESKPFFDRNRDIVDDSDLMIACPNGKNYHGGKGGTNYTIRYALKVGKPIIIIFPDGETEKHNIDENI